MPLIIVIPLLFALIGAVVSFVIARLQGLKGAAFWAQIAGGVLGGLLGGFLTVPCLGLGAVVTAATVGVLPETVAGAAGVATEYAALGVGSGAASGVGQVVGNAVTGDPLMKDVGSATVLGGAGQILLTPVGNKLAVALTPVIPVAARTIGVALGRVHVVPSRTVTQALGVVGTRMGGDTATEALTDGATMVVPPPGHDESKPTPPEKGFTSALEGAFPGE